MSSEVALEHFHDNILAPPLPSPQIDYNRLTFPSDALTIGAIRAAEPELFAQLQPTFFQSGCSNLDALLFSERELARDAFERALGRPKTYQESRRELIGMLSSIYKFYGLATGGKHTEQLVRAFEETARAQAKEHIGKGKM